MPRQSLRTALRHTQGSLDLKGSDKFIKERPPRFQKWVADVDVFSMRHQGIASHVVENFLNVSAKSRKFNALLKTYFYEALQLQPNLCTFKARQKSMCAWWSNLPRNAQKWKGIMCDTLFPKMATGLKWLGKWDWSCLAKLSTVP